MISIALTTFLVSVFAGTVVLVTVNKERRRGRRFFAAHVRAWCDTKVAVIEDFLVRNFEHFIKYILQLNWYYSIHSVLRTTLRAIVAAYTYVENVFEKNRARTKRLRAEKRQLSEYNHLQQMAAHRKDTALTPAQQRKLRKKKLEGKE